MVFVLELQCTSIVGLGTHIEVQWEKTALYMKYFKVHINLCRFTGTFGYRRLQLDSELLGKWTEELLKEYKAGKCEVFHFAKSNQSRTFTANTLENVHKCT